MSTDPNADELLHGILKQVSRSFYLTLNVLPDGVREQMGLSYLFARAADTIADTDLIDRAQRLKYLHLFQAQFTSAGIDWNDVREIQAALAPHQKDSAESVLLQRLGDCLKLYEGYYHDLLNDLGSEAVFEDIDKWIEARLPVRQEAAAAGPGILA